uniref:Putative reverse transcriptase domain-containing protein n=1 Tax=Tanacetum cinerariifolium TaxID=118510 RepID=A0A699KI61_TANCI|nr:putative reverse transcriptase domain-containing protein [Tanacetum cinerariifolium]
MHYRHFELTVMPFGLTNAPVVYTKSKEEHESHLKMNLELLKKEKCHVKPNKEAHATKYSVRPRVSKMKYDLRYTNWWPSMRKDIVGGVKNMFRACVRNFVVVGILTFCEAEIKESKMIGLELEQETTKIVMIKERLKEAKDHQES